MSTANKIAAVDKLRSMVAWCNNSKEDACHGLKSVAEIERVYDAWKGSAWDMTLDEIPIAAIDAACDEKRGGGHDEAVQIINVWMEHRENHVEAAEGCEHCEEEERTS